MYICMILEYIDRELAEVSDVSLPVCRLYLVVRLGVDLLYGITT